MIDLLLGHYFDPGDSLMLTAAVRELNLAYPGEYRVAVDISVPEIWENNPWVVPVERIGHPRLDLECAYPLINLINDLPYHFILGFVQHGDCGADPRRTPSLRPRTDNALPYCRKRQCRKSDGK